MAKVTKSPAKTAITPPVEVKEGTPKIFVKGLPQDCTKAEVRNFFSEFGKVVDIVYKYGADTNRVKGLAFVLFKDQETADQLIEKKIIEMEDHKLEIRKPKEEGKKGEDPSISVPKEALKCFVCRKNKFLTLESFFHHKQAKQHTVLLKMFRAKSASVLQLLRAESKLAADRLYDMRWIKANPNKETPYCEVCQVHINYDPARHEKSAEHKMVLSYINKKCCDINFQDRFKYENHLLSLKHLKNTYEKEQQKNLNKLEDRLTMKKAIDIYKQADSDLKELKEKYPDLDLNEELPPFTGEPIGFNHIVKKINYYCICCDQKFFANPQFVKPHCRSYNHYTNMVDFIKDIEVDFRKKKRIEKEEEKLAAKKPKDLEDIEIKKRDREESKEGTEETVSKKAKTDNDKSKEEDKDDHDDDMYEMEEEAEHEEEEEEVGEEPDEQQEEHEDQQEEPEEQEMEAEGGEEQSQEEVTEDSEAQNEEEAIETEDSKAEEDAPAEEAKEEEEEEEVVEAPKPKAARGRRGRGRGRGARR